MRVNSGRYYNKEYSESAGHQIKRLADCIADYYPNEPGRLGEGETAVDVAIRLLTEFAERYKHGNDATIYPKSADARAACSNGR